MKEKLKLLGFCFCSSVAIGFDILSLYQEKYQSLLKLDLLGSALLLLVIYYFYSKNERKKHFTISILSGLFTFFMIFGNSYMHLGNASLVFKNIGFFLISVIMAIGYYILFQYLLSFLFSFLDSKHASLKLPKFLSNFEKKPFLFSILFILICWLPYILSFYPIILSPDPSYQIKQFFGIRTKYADYSVLLDENVVMTNHHPVAHTVLLGGCLKIGHLIGQDNLGLFFYSMIQIAVLSSVLAFTISYMKKMKVSSRFRLIALLIYSLVPMFPLYAMSGVKDVLFSAFTCLYILLIHHILTSKGKGYSLLQYIGMGILMLLLILFRNNGLHMILLSFPFLILAVKKYWKPFTVLFVSVLVLSTAYSKVLLPALHITPGSIREMLSIPFQQTARYVKYHEEDMNEDEKHAIDKVLGYEDLASRYNPELSDPVKNNFNKYTTNDDLKKYFEVWFHCFWRHPGTYVDATINNVYGFFYPEKLNWYVYHNYDKRILVDGFDYHFNMLKLPRRVLSGFAIVFPYIPILGLLSNIGFAVWSILILVGYSIYQRKYSNILVYLPALVLILVCIAGPANTYFRYALPFIFSLPFMVSCIFQKQKS